LTYTRGGQQKIYVIGYREKGNVDTPLRLAIKNKTSRFSLAIEAMNQIPALGNSAATVREDLLKRRIRVKAMAY
jgi:xylulose-5-phosphate/fructose-6-phosphate phosphoketolase